MKGNLCSAEVINIFIHIFTEPQGDHTSACAAQHTARTCKAGARPTCIQQPQGAVWRIALVALIDGLVGSLALEECHLLCAVIHEPLAYQGTRGGRAVEADVITDPGKAVWQRRILQVKR